MYEVGSRSWGVTDVRAIQGLEAAQSEARWVGPIWGTTNRPVGLAPREVCTGEHALIVEWMSGLRRALIRRQSAPTWRTPLTRPGQW